MSVWEAFRQALVSSKRGQSLPLSFFVISACNPLATKLSWQDNQTLHWALHRYLLRRFPDAQLMEAVGYSADGQWEEPSWAIHGTDEKQATAIGKLFWQLAIFRFDEHGRHVASCISASSPDD